MALPKIVFTDIDGVWTDGGMYYDETGNEWKKFNTSDSAGVIFLRLLDIPLVFLTSECTEIVTRRAEKLRVTHVLQGVTNKLATASDFCKAAQISLDHVAFIGNDINDLQLLKAAGLSATPADAPDYVREHATWVLSKRGGEGVFREFIERLLTEERRMDTVLSLYFSDLQTPPAPSPPANRSAGTTSREAPTTEPRAI